MTDDKRETESIEEEAVEEETVYEDELQVEDEQEQGRRPEDPGVEPLEAWRQISIYDVIDSFRREQNRDGFEHLGAVVRAKGTDVDDGGHLDVASQAESQPGRQSVHYEDVPARQASSRGSARRESLYDRARNAEEQNRRVSSGGGLFGGGAWESATTPVRGPRDRASQGSGSTQYRSPLEEEIVFESPNSGQSTTNQKTSREDDPKTRHTVVRQVIINGKPFRISDAPRNTVTPVLSKRYDCTCRGSLSGEDLEDFVRHATGYVLAKHNKFASPKVEKAEQGSLLAHLRNVDRQIADIERHIIRFDFEDVFTIVKPINVTQSRSLKQNENGEAIGYNLFREYAQLTIDEVALSNTWYNTWCSETWIRQNLDLGYDVLKNNTEQSLWQLCEAEYDTYVPCQRGGPLMFHIIITRLRAQTQETIKRIAESVDDMDIKKFQGEDIDMVVSHIRAAYHALMAASTEEHQYVPKDFNYKVLQVFKTTSIKKFSDLFANAEAHAEHDALMQHLKYPVYPNVEDILTWATTKYRNLKQEGEWDVPKGSKSSAFHAGSGCNHGHRELICWNCGKKGHSATECKAPRNEENIKKHLEQFKQKKKGRRKGKSKDKPKRKMEDGRPVVLNKKGVYVLDQKKSREMKKEAAKKELTDKLAAVLGTAAVGQPSAPPAPTPAPPASAPAETPAQPSANSAQVASWRAVLESFELPM